MIRFVSGLRIIGWGTAVPERIVTNHDLAETLHTSDEWITERTGIKERRIGGTTTSLGTQAGRAALQSAGLQGADIDVLLLATTTSDQLIPATAPAIADALGISGGAVDLNAACSGFVYGLIMANGLLATGAKRILLIGAETLSTVTDWTDRSNAMLFGDGAGALVLDATEGPGWLLGWDLGVDGSATHILRCEHGGTIEMDGKEVFRRAVRVVVESAHAALERADLKPSEVTLIVPHQANLRIIQAACQRLGIEEERAAIVIDRYGNTSSASIPLALADSLDSGRVNPGDILLLTGFGAGMTWASAVIEWAP